MEIEVFVGTVGLKFGTSPNLMTFLHFKEKTSLGNSNLLCGVHPVA